MGAAPTHDYYWPPHSEPAELTDREQQWVQEVEFWSARLRDLAE
jgi:hypothetical protein